MWMPVEVRPRGGEGVRASIVAQLARSVHYRAVSERQRVSEPLSADAETAERVMRELEACSIVYAGGRHGAVFAPFCAFSVAREFGVARVEHLIAHGAPPEDASITRWLGNEVEGILLVLLHEHREIEQVALPLPVTEFTFERIEVKRVGERSYAVRR